MSTEQALGPARPSSGAPAVRRIQASRGFAAVDLAEVWRYRELLYRLIWRDVKARYKQTFLGGLWAIFRPLVSMVLMAAVFGGLAGFHSGTDVPYPLFLYSGILVWTYFASALTGATGSLINYAGMLGKVYFPRLYAPLAASTAPLVDFALALVVLFGLFGYYARTPPWQIVLLPLFVLIALVVALGIGLWLSGISVKYRDVPFAIPFIVQLWFYATPVLYPLSRLPEPYASLLALNPLTSVVEGFRWAMLGVTPPAPAVLAGSSAIGAVVLVSGAFFFRRTERTIADLL